MELELFTTYGGGSWYEHFYQTAAFKPDSGAENEVVNLYPEFEFDRLEGFGGALTDAAGYVYSLMDEKQKKQMMETYFSKNHMGYRNVRIHMDSCDFSTGLYEAMSDPQDKEFKSFSFERTEKYILPMLKDAQEAAGEPLELMLSPWSPPAFMKTNGQRTFGGSLKPEYRRMWADYICRYIQEFKDRGFKVKRISLQNEPKAVQTWDSCIYTAEEEKVFLRDFMYPALKEHGLEDVEIFIWDHNKERVYDRLRDIVDEKTDSMVSGVAFHWYSGDHFEALDLVRKKYPDKKMIISESCIEFNKFDSKDAVKSAHMLSHEIIGDLNNGMTAFYDWNVLLDEEGGPNHVGNYCLAPFLFDREKKRLMPQLVQQYFEHFSHYLIPGSVRIGFSKYTEKLDVTAYKRPDGKLVLIVLNKEKKAMAVNVRLNGQCASMLLYPESITSAFVK